MHTAPAVTPAPQPMTSTEFGMRRQQRRQVAEHALQPHVLRLARRLHLAGVVVVQHAVRELRHRDRRVHPFADVDEVVGVLESRREPAAVRDEQRRHGRHAHASAARRSPPSRRRATCGAACVVSFDTPVDGDRNERDQRAQRRHGDQQALRGRCVPSHAMSSRLAEQRADDSRRSCSRRRRRRRAAPDPVAPRPTAASASGKLAPQSTAAGSTDQRQRTKSSWNVDVASTARPGLTGQYGSDLRSASTRSTRSRRVSSSWHTPSATPRLLRRPRDDRADAAAEPEPDAGTRRESARTCTSSPPSNSDNRRVQTTSAASAVVPDSAIATYTGHAPAERSSRSPARRRSRHPRRDTAVARARAMRSAATITLIATATYVAIAMSCTRSR